MGCKGLHLPFFSDINILIYEDTMKCGVMRVSWGQNTICRVIHYMRCKIKSFSSIERYRKDKRDDK